VGLWELAFAAGVVVNPVANCCVWDVVFEGAAGFAAFYGREGDLLHNLGCVLRSCRGLLCSASPRPVRYSRPARRAIVISILVSYADP
jgi:hypothetical protein